MMVIAIERSDGAVCVMRLIGDADAQTEVDKWNETAKPHHAVSFREVDDDSLPSRRFRSAWRMVGGVIAIDKPIALKQIVAEARAKRDELLTKSDGDKARLDEIGTTSQQKAVKEYRQKLRDLPAVVAAEIESMTVDQLENYKPQFPTIGE